ncbi:Cytochrome b5 heme-binding domain-containing protein [Mucor velutinosus]|uniref:Cytochrome b5 heme-binding domain-containing protein n=1 Tax=Mucor velutinosus TaxID=708070 RepID=A0AAN7D509_9FUNG|nr:Cytochrome b5 heme-binding domain-containing protein [Mucor velutinosus]
MSEEKSMGHAYRNTEEGSFGVLNFRDLGVSSADNAEKKKYVKEGLVFRSATLDNMSQEDVDAFIKAHNINTILDLRTGMEGREGLPIDKSFPTSALDSLDASTLVDDDVSIKAQTSENFDTTGHGTLIRKKYRVDFAGKNFQRYCVFASCSFHLKLYIIYLMAFCQRKKAAYIIGQKVLTPMGVNKMYREFATYCKAEIREALMVFADPQNYPIEIHCTQGKDRTGMVSALILSIAGVPEDIIVNDYAKTQKALAPIYDEMLEEVRRSGLSEDFAQAPPQNMRDLLSFLNKEYGSIENYLDAIGFGKELRDRVRSVICV